MSRGDTPYPVFPWLSKLRPILYVNFLNLTFFKGSGLYANYPLKRSIFFLIQGSNHEHNSKNICS